MKWTSAYSLIDRHLLDLSVPTETVTTLPSILFLSMWDLAALQTGSLTQPWPKEPDELQGIALPTLLSETRQSLATLSRREAGKTACSACINY